MINFRSIATIGIGYTKQAIAKLGIIIAEVLSVSNNPAGVLFDPEIKYNTENYTDISYYVIFDNQPEKEYYPENYTGIFYHVIFDNQIVYNNVEIEEIFNALFDAELTEPLNALSDIDNNFDIEKTYTILFDKLININHINIEDVYMADFDAET